MGFAGADLLNGVGNQACMFQGRYVLTETKPLSWTLLGKSQYSGPCVNQQDTLVVSFHFTNRFFVSACVIYTVFCDTVIKTFASFIG